MRCLIEAPAARRRITWKRDYATTGYLLANAGHVGEKMIYVFGVKKSIAEPGE